MGKTFSTSSLQLIRFDEKNGFTLLEEMRECIFRYRNGLKFAQGILESMILSRPSAVGEICDRMTLYRCFLGLEPQVQVQVQVHLFTLIQLQYNNKEKKEEVKNRANYTLN